MLRPGSRYRPKRPERREPVRRQDDQQEQRRCVGLPWNDPFSAPRSGRWCEFQRYPHREDRRDHERYGVGDQRGGDAESRRAARPHAVLESLRSSAGRMSRRPVLFECVISHVHNIGNTCRAHEGRLDRVRGHLAAGGDLLRGECSAMSRVFPAVAVRYRTTSTASIETALPPSAAMRAASSRTGPSATSNCCGSSVVNRRRMTSVLTPITESRGPVIPTSVM